MKRGGTSKTSNKKKIYQNAGKPKSEIRMTQRDRDEQSRKSESMQYKGGTTKKPVYKSNNFKAGMTREEVQNMPGGTGGNVAKKSNSKKSDSSNNRSSSKSNNFKAGQSREKVQNTPGGRGGYTNAKPESGPNAKPNNSGPNPSVESDNRSSSRGGYINTDPKSGPDAKPNPSVKKPIKKKASSYAEAKKRNPNLDNLIKKRKGLSKGTTEYNMVQNKINKAYGIGPTNRKEMTKMDSKPVPKVKLKSTLAVKTPAKSSATPVKKKVVSKTSPTGGSGMGSINRQKQAIKDLGIEESKEINFNSKKEPVGRKVDIEKRTNKSQDKKSDRKNKRAVKKTLKEDYKKAKKNVGNGQRTLKGMLMRKEGGKRKGMGGMKDYRS